MRVLGGKNEEKRRKLKKRDSLRAFPPPSLYKVPNLSPSNSRDFFNASRPVNKNKQNKYVLNVVIASNRQASRYIDFPVCQARFVLDLGGVVAQGLVAKEYVLENTYRGFKRHRRDTVDGLARLSAAPP